MLMQKKLWDFKHLVIQINFLVPSFPVTGSGGKKIALCFVITSLPNLDSNTRNVCESVIKKINFDLII